MRTRILAVLIFLSPSAQAIVDYTCQQDCLNAGRMLTYCAQACDIQTSDDYNAYQIKTKKQDSGIYTQELETPAERQERLLNERIKRGY